MQRVNDGPYPYIFLLRQLVQVVSYLVEAHEVSNDSVNTCFYHITNRAYSGVTLKYFFFVNQKIMGKKIFTILSI